MSSPATAAREGRKDMRLRRLALAMGGMALALILSVPCQASAAMAVSLRGHPARTLTPGARISVTVRALPAARHAYCLGLASAIDRASLPLNLGHVARDRRGVGRIVATIPARLLPAEPAGPYLLFVGTCTPVAPDRPFVARTMIRIVPA